MGNSENIELTNRPSQENSQNVEMRHSGTSGNADANADVDTNAPPAVFSVTASNQDANANDILNSNQGRGQGLALCSLRLRARRRQAWSPLGAVRLQSVVSGL